jgi:cell division septum initiation protein DivIVA
VTLNVNVDVHVYWHGSLVEQQKLDLILDAVKTLIEEEKEIMADLTTLTAQVQQNTDVEASAIVLLNGLSAQIAQIKNDPVALQALADQLKTSSTSLADAITANTQAA